MSPPILSLNKFTAAELDTRLENRYEWRFTASAFIYLKQCYKFISFRACKTLWSFSPSQKLVPSPSREFTNFSEFETAQSDKCGPSRSRARQKCCWVGVIRRTSTMCSLCTFLTIEQPVKTDLYRVHLLNIEQPVKTDLYTMHACAPSQHRAACEGGPIPWSKCTFWTIEQPVKKMGIK